jgi:hypothetical protein
MLGSLSDEPRDSMCPDVVTLFSQHLEGDINPSVCAAMETHLALCGRCRSACEVLKRALAACRQLPTPEVPASIAASIRAAIRTVLDKQELDRVRCASYRWVYGLFDERSRDNAQFPRKVMIGEPCYG